MLVRMKPVGVATVVNQFDTDCMLIKIPNMVSHPAQWHPLFDTAVAVNIKMPAIAGLGHWVECFFAPDSRHVQVGQFGTMNNDLLDAVYTAAIKPFSIGQWALSNFQKLALL